MEKLIIDRSKWRTGSNGENQTGKGETLLLNRSGYMCCLGFMCVQSGIEKRACLGIGMPSDLNQDLFNNISILVDLTEYNICATDFSDDAMDINDAEDLTSKEREELLKCHFATKGIIVEFINDYKI
jgi:hypothetical protein